MRYWHTRALDSATTLEERKAAAEALVARRDGSAFSIFETRVLGASAAGKDGAAVAATDALTRDASAYGLSLLATREGNLSATEAICAAVPKLNAPERASYSRSLGTVAKHFANPQGTSKIKEEDAAKHQAAIGKALTPLLADPEAAVRKAAVDTLQEVPAPGVCVALIPVATNDADAAVKTAASNALPATALPEAASGLLNAMASSDELLKTKAAEAFAKVRRESKSEDLLPLVSSPSEFVRREIVTVLGKRGGDPKAAEGVTLALKDALPDIRKLAVKAVPVTGVSGALSQVLPLIGDADEGVRIATAEALGDMRDDNSKKVLLEAFGANPTGSTMEALIKALGRRASGKDLAAIGIVIQQMNKSPDSFKGISEALVMLTNAHQGLSRDTERRGWTAEKWNAWFANISKREKMRADAAQIVEKARARAGDTKSFPELAKMLHEAVDAIEKCVEMSKPNDTEDIAALEALEKEYSTIMYQFTKFQTTDKGR